MAKKLTFIFMVIVLMIAGAVASMAIEEDIAALKNLSGEKSGSWFTVPTMNTVVNELPLETYSHEAVVMEYSSMFFDKSLEYKDIYLMDICIQRDKTSDDIQDYVLSATVINEVPLKDDDSIVIMAFVEEDDSFTLVGTSVGIGYMGTIKMKMPNQGKAYPNNVRVVAFPKSAYKDLQQGVNVEITDWEIVVEKQGFNVKSTLLSPNGIMKHVHGEINLP